MTPDLTLCMIVKNEERNLQACLDSIRGVASEIVIVDTGSTDATAQVAASNGADVIPFDFTFVDFAAARNHAIAHATGKWIFVLDADESLDPGSLPLIEELVTRDKNAGYYMVRHNHIGDSGQFTADYAVRLFPNRPNYRYRGRVHETIDAAILSAGGRLRRCDVRIDHNSSSSRETRRGKNHWYIGILQEEIAANPDDDTRLDFLAAEYHQLEMFDEAAAVAERIVRARPLDPAAHLNAGIYHLLYKPDCARARTDFSRALELKPGYPEAAAFLESLNRQARTPDYEL